MRKWLYIGLLVVCCFAGAYSGNVVTQVPKLVGYDSVGDSAIVANDTLKGYWISVGKFPIFIATQKILTDTLTVYNANSNLVLGSGNYLQFGSGVITLLAGITDTVEREYKIPEPAGGVLSKGYTATDSAAYDSTKFFIRGGHDASGNYLVAIDSTVWSTDHNRYFVVGFVKPDRCDSLLAIKITASSAENSVDSGMVWAGLKKGSVDSSGVGWQNEDLIDRDSTSTSALDTLVLDNTESYVDGDVAYVVIKFMTKAGNGRSGMAAYYLRKMWAEWKRTQL